MPKFKLRIPERDLAHWAELYAYPPESEIEDGVAPAARSRGYLTREEFLRLCLWKTPRSQSRCAANEAEFVQEVTRVALSAAHEELKIGILRLLKGVSWPTGRVCQVVEKGRGQHPTNPYAVFLSDCGMSFQPSMVRSLIAPLRSKPKRRSTTALLLGRLA
jgi:hypothetical protein